MYVNYKTWSGNAISGLLGWISTGRVLGRDLLSSFAKLIAPKRRQVSRSWMLTTLFTPSLKGLTE